MIITKNIYIYSRNTKLCIKNKFNIIHRNYPGSNKDVGHIKKIIDKLPPTTPPSQSVTTQALSKLHQTKTPASVLGSNDKVVQTEKLLPQTPAVSSLQEAAKNFQKECNENSSTGNFQKNLEQYNDKDHPLSIQLKKLQYTSLDGKVYETSINKNTTANDITNDHLQHELSIRGLNTFIPGKKDTSVKVLLENGEEVTIGKSKYKFTVLGQAYSEKYDQEHPVELLPNTMEPISQNPKFIIGVVLPNENVFMASAEQKHLLCIYSESEDKYYIIGYLTSKHGIMLLKEKQFKAFQDEQEGMTSNNEKKQYIYISNNLEPISPENIKIVKWGAKYLDSVDDLIKQDLKESLEVLKQNSMKTFNFNGISKQKCIEICRMYDETCIKKGKHPLTQEQELANQLSKIKNEEENKNKKLLKNKKEENQSNDEIINPFIS